jgi:SAM-dependent methyltransferase
MVVRDRWEIGGAYEAYVGRWSRVVAGEFVRWLEMPAGRRWLDVGCGTGALTATVRSGAAPSGVVGVDRSHGFLTDAHGPRTAGDARALPFPDGRFDAVVSGLAINFVPEPAAAAAELARVAAPGGVVAAYVWDYAEGMTMMRHLWDAALALDPAALELDEARRFAVCRPEPLRDLWAGAGLTDVATRAIEIWTVFRDFDDYWQPFLGGQGAAPAYVMSLPEGRRQALRDAVRERLPIAADGSIALTARAWAVRGRR